MNILLFPFKLIWNLIGLLFNLTGRLVGVILGLALAILGGVLTITVLGAFAGIPLLIFGIALAIRSLF